LINAAKTFKLEGMKTDIVKAIDKANDSLETAIIYIDKLHSKLVYVGLAQARPNKGGGGCFPTCHGGAK